MPLETLIKILTVCSPMIVALIPIIPTIISNRRKTDQIIKATNESTRQQIAEVQSTLAAHIREDEDERARNQRYRILNFYDEMCEHQGHSESHFEDILDDIDDYERYCEAHPDFRNSRGKVAMAYIKDSYGKIKARGGFLTHDPDR